jgi:hypothetical protein
MPSLAAADCETGLMRPYEAELHDAMLRQLPARNRNGVPER